MRGAPYTNPAMPPPVTGRSFRRIGVTLATVGVLVLGGIILAVKLRGDSAAKAQAEKAVTPWKSQSVYPPMEEKVHAIPPAPRDDPYAARLAAMEQQMRLMPAALEDLKKRRGGTTINPPPAPAHQAAAVTPKAPGAPLYIANKVELAALASTVQEYTLAPGATKLPCVVETKIVSDVEGYFTCRVMTNVYDTATGRHLLVPQGSTVLGNDQANDLVYGSNRMDTVSLTLTLPDGRSVDLGRAPVTDQQGVAGLTGDVDNHYLKLFGAVFIGGALKGGISAMQVAMSDAAGAGQITSGLTSLGNQATNKVIQPYINIRPTITVEAGQLANVLLIKALTLPAMWQGGTPPGSRPGQAQETVQAKTPPTHGGKK